MGNVSKRQQPDHRADNILCTDRRLFESSIQYMYLSFNLMEMMLGKHIQKLPHFVSMQVAFMYSSVRNNCISQYLYKANYINHIKI